MPTVEEFLCTVLRSGLLERKQLQETLRSVPTAKRADSNFVAEHLIRHGKLTRFQATKLLEGTALGLVLGPYQVLSPISRGGMGTVYLARDRRSQTLVALKVLPPKKAQKEERLLARFRREMEMCQRVAHPHVAWTMEVGVCQGVYFIAMEYIPGRTLHRLVMAEGPLSVPRAARLFCEVCEALEHIHQQGLIHRDMKPSNIVVTPHDHAKLLDLGLALVKGEPPSDKTVVGGQGYVVGTMDFISPEQAVDPCNVDERSDLYALGCTLYHSFTAQLPFPGGSPSEKIQRQKTEAPVPVRELSPDLPLPLVQLIGGLMSKRPGDRPASAEEVHNILKPWASAEPVLPLDRPEDATYHQAVEELEQHPPPGDSSA